MRLPILAIDKNIEVHTEQKNAALAEGGIPSIRVDSMSEGIEKLMNTEFYYIAINADNINYLPQLKIMSDMSPNAPILIVINPSDYTTAKYSEAIDNGAESFGPWAATAEENYTVALSIVRKFNKQARRPVKASKPPLSHKNIMFHRDQHIVCVNDCTVKLTPLQYKILLCLLNNRGRTLTYGQIIRYAWGSNYVENSNRVLFTQVNDLRKRLGEFSPGCDYIENVREVGYRLII